MIQDMKLLLNGQHHWWLVVWRSLALINEVNQRRARLVLRWVTVSRFNSRWGTFISVC